mgnify:FL=1
MTTPGMFSSSNTIAVILLCGVVSSIIVFTQSCNVRNACVSRGTCKESERFAVCSFSNVVNLHADAAYRSSGNEAALQASLQGVCSPGDRFQKRDQTSEEYQCLPYFPFPSALNEEIMDPSHSDPHMRACGKWIEAGEPKAWGSAVSRPGEGHDEWLSALKSAEDSVTSMSGNAKDAMSKFRNECLRTTALGSHTVRNAAMIAYKHMDDAISSVQDEASFFKAVGFVAGHHCEGPVQIDNTDLAYDNDSERFNVRFRDGYNPPSGVLSESLQLLGVEDQIAQSAEAANRAIQQGIGDVDGTIYTSSAISLLSGAMDVDYVLENSNFPMHGSSKLLASTVSRYSVDPSGTLDYLRGLSAFCVLSLLSNVGHVGTLVEGALQEIKGSRPWTPSLRAPYSGAEGVVNETLLSSVRITLSTLSGDANSDCLQLMRKLFPDSLEESRFAATVDSGLYEKLEPLVERVRAGMHAAVAKWPLRDVLANYVQAQHYVATTRIRISGAPRGSWAGIKSPISYPRFASSDGVFLMALKQSRATFRTNMALSLEKTDRCDGILSFAESTARNAYLRYGTPDCSNLFLGMATRPYLDAQYDDDSLMSRGVAIIGHELGHVLGHMRFFPDEFLLEPFKHLLKKYNIDFTRDQTKTYQSEAIADLAAALAIVESGVDKEVYLMNWCQLWCARVPLGWQPYADASHPQHNQRCDFLYNTLTDSTLTP